MGPRGTDSRLHLHSGSHCAFEFRSQGACRVGWGGVVVHGRAWNRTFRKRIMSVWPGHAWGYLALV